MFTVPTFKFLIKKLAVLRSFVQTPEDNPKAVELETFATSSKSLDTLRIGIIGPKVSSTTNSLLGFTCDLRQWEVRAPLVFRADTVPQLHLQLLLVLALQIILQHLRSLLFPYLFSYPEDHQI
jgi:hypothetical protein